MFLIPILIFFKKKIFWVIIALFAIFKCKCEKNCTFSNILQKLKSYFFQISIILRLIPIKFETLKPPNVCCRVHGFDFVKSTDSKISINLCIFDSRIKKFAKIVSKSYYHFFANFNAERERNGSNAILLEHELKENYISYFRVRTFKLLKLIHPK